MDHQRKWFSYYAESLSISVKVPVGWEVGTNDDFELLLLAPPVDGFKANVGFSAFAFTGEEAAFIETIEKYKHQLKLEYPEYKMEREEQCWIDGFPAYHQLYSWFSPEQKKRVIQTFSLLYDTESRMYQINGTSLSDLPENLVSLIEEIVSSVRLVQINDL